MGKVTRDLIEYEGISSYDNMLCPIEASTNLKQANIDLKLCLPKKNPPIEQIMKVKVDKKIIKTKVVKTPVGTSIEGQNLTGYKVLVMADIYLKIMYVALTECQDVHSYHVTVPFCEYVVMPEDFNTLGVVVPNIIIEDLYLKQCDKKCLYGSMVVMTVVEPCTTGRRSCNV